MITHPKVIQRGSSLPWYYSLELPYSLLSWEYSSKFSTSSNNSTEKTLTRKTTLQGSLGYSEVSMATNSLIFNWSEKLSSSLHTSGPTIGITLWRAQKTKQFCLKFLTTFNNSFSIIFYSLTFFTHSIRYLLLRSQVFTNTHSTIGTIQDMLFTCKNYFRTSLQSNLMKILCCILSCKKLSMSFF